MTRVVLTGVTISGQDIVENDHDYVTIQQVIDNLPLRLTSEQKAVLRKEALQVLNARRNKR